ncbi:MAG TPA: recombinase family protein [Pirellulales bacterium]|nr:recombinase family protein [Pirellulales bacterium]
MQTDKKTAVYVRVSSHSQNTRSQDADLRRYVDAYDVDAVWYVDKATGTNMDRPEWNRLWADVLAGKIDRIIVWRVDRLGRTVSGLAQLYDELIRRKVTLTSIKESFDLLTKEGRLTATILTGVAAYETEVRRERQTAGISAALAAGKSWGGRKAGHRNKSVLAKARAIRKLHHAGESIAAIARTCQVSRPTVYDILSS